MVFISELDVSLNDDQENTLLLNGFKKLPVPLSTTQGGDSVFLWYKEDANPGITRIQFSYTDEMIKGLKDAEFTKVGKNINTGPSAVPVFLWYLKGTGIVHTCIKQIEVSRDDEVKKFRVGWERQSFNLKRSDGAEHAFLWVKREKVTYIQKMLITNSHDKDAENFRAGYIRVDESTNRSADGKPVFLWYLPTQKGDACVTLQVSTNPAEFQHCQSQGYRPVEYPINLNEGNEGNIVNLWYKQEDPGQKPIQNLVLIYDEKRKNEYESGGVTFLDKNLNSANGSPCFPATPLYLGYYQ